MEDNNLNNAFNKLQNMLSSEDGKKDLENIVGSFANNPTPTPYEGMSAGDGMGSFNSAKSFINNFDSDNDPRANLLRALKPYLSQTRHGHVDNAIKIMSLGNLPNLIKLLRK